MLSLRSSLLCTLLLLGMHTSLHAQAAPAQEGDSAVVRQARRASWLSDRRDFKVGDVVTLLIDESTSAADRSRRRGDSARGTSASASAAVRGNSVLGNTGFSTGTESSERESQEVVRRDELVTQVSVLVTEVLPGGVLRVSGERSLSVDRNSQELRVSGLLRPEDISSQGVAHSSRLANADIEYRGRKPRLRPGLLGRVLSLLWP